MDALREGIGLRAYAQTSPLVEYQREGYDMFQETLRAIQDETLRTLFRVRITADDGAALRAQPRAVARPTAQVRETAGVGAAGGGAAGSGAGGGGAAAAGSRSAAPVTSGPKIGRNDPCWCGSGKKYKKCHGREA
jgi:preprotein translocase subunit SecA